MPVWKKDSAAMHKAKCQPDIGTDSHRHTNTLFDSTSDETTSSVVQSARVSRCCKFLQYFSHQFHLVGHCCCRQRRRHRGHASFVRMRYVKRTRRALKQKLLLQPIISWFSKEIYFSSSYYSTTTACLCALCCWRFRHHNNNDRDSVSSRSTSKQDQVNE